MGFCFWFSAEGNILPQGCLAMSKDFFGCLQPGRYYWPVVIGGQEGCEMPYISASKMTPYNKELSGPKVQ